MVALVGNPKVGKSYTIDLLRKEGYKTLKADSFFNSVYQLNKPGYNLIKEKLGSKYLSSDGVNKAVLKKYALFHLNDLSRWLHPLLEKHLQTHKYDFVEIPILASRYANFTRYFSFVVHVTPSPFKNQEIPHLKNVDKLFFHLVKQQNQAGIRLADVDIVVGCTKKLRLIRNFCTN